MEILRVNFKDGVYLNGTVKQNIGLAGNVSEMSGVSGLTMVKSITANAGGIVVGQTDRAGEQTRYFFVPWASIASCEVRDPAPASATDLLGDDVALERATRPPGKPSRA